MRPADVLARFPDADVIHVGGRWFVRPEAAGTDVGPYATEEEAWDWLRQIRPDDATGAA